MFELKDFNLPSFVRFPFFTDRTGWLPFGLPLILVVPHSRDTRGTSIANTAVDRVKVSISEEGKVPVAGHDNVGIFYPDFELFSKEISVSELLSRRVSLSSVNFLDTDGNHTTQSNAEYIEFTSRAGIIGKIKYLPHASYIDISDFKLETEQLQHGRYTLTYEAHYYKRVISDDNELLHVDTDNMAISRHRFMLNHPGDVLMMMVENTPQLYFEKSGRSEDPTVSFYRPFSEILQDVHDEQKFLKNINWIYDIPPENIPYLGFILGWPLPYFPDSVDALRRTMLRNIVRLQKLKGTKRVIRELFDLFGFAIDISNVWWTPDGQHFLAPGEDLPGFPQHQIGLFPVVTTEPLFLNYSESGFLDYSIPLVNRPKDKSITLRAYLVEDGSPAHQFLTSKGDQLSDDFGALDYLPLNSYEKLDSEVSDVEAMQGVVGQTTAVIDKFGRVSKEITKGNAPFNEMGIKHDFISNIISLGSNRYLDGKNTKLFVFATYVYNKIEVPENMKQLQSNRFDVEIVKKDGEQVEPDVVLFLMDFLFRIKAFHSILRKVLVSIIASDTYQVTDFCVGGEVKQDINFDAGKQQVPPEAIIPDIPEDGRRLRPEDYGYRLLDIQYRRRILDDLDNEFDVWKVLQENCGANEHGQDRSAIEPDLETEIIDAFREDRDAGRDTLCELDGSDYCYLGRPQDSTSYLNEYSPHDSWFFKACDLHVGKGTYYLHPSYVAKNELIKKYLAAGLSPQHSGMLESKYRLFNSPDKHTLHFSATDGLTNHDDASNWLALSRPSLFIQRDNMGFPGHRFPSMFALEEDFVHSKWKLKPWDLDIICECGEPRYDNSINARLEIVNGQEKLVFDDMPYSIEGNSLVQDIKTFDEYEETTDAIDPDDVTHSIYAEVEGGNDAISLDGMEQHVGIKAVDKAIFTSAVKCGTDIYDYSEGYPSETGVFDYDEEIDYFEASKDPQELADGLEFPVPNSTDRKFLFRMISQIRVHKDDHDYDNYRPSRLDCGCERLSCTDVTGVDETVGVGLLSDIPTCQVDEFIDKYGSVENDQVEFDHLMVLRETLGARSLNLSQKQLSLFVVGQNYQTSGWKLDAQSSEYGDNYWPDNGEFTYKDEYGVIYEVKWETIGPYLDITTIINSPRVWGERDGHGEIINREVFIDGTITVERRVFIKDGDVYKIAAEATEQEEGRFQSTYLCDAPFANPFLIFLNHGLQDTLEWAVDCGSSWTGAEDGTDANVVWTDADGPDGGEQPMIWVDIHDSHDLTAVCD